MLKEKFKTKKNGIALKAQDHIKNSNIYCKSCAEELQGSFLKVLIILPMKKEGIAAQV